MGLKPGGPSRRAAVLTTGPNELVRPVHDRMTVILRPEDYARWLDPAAEDPSALLVPYPADAMGAVPVGRHVNHARNEGSACLAP